jgi:hypothetical protein
MDLVWNVFTGPAFGRAATNCQSLLIPATSAGFCSALWAERSVGGCFIPTLSRKPIVIAGRGNWGGVVILSQSAGMGAGRAATGCAFVAAGTSAGTSSHLRTSGRAFRMATSPEVISSPARLKSS